MRSLLLLRLLLKFLQLLCRRFLLQLLLLRLRMLRRLLLLHVLPPRGLKQLMTTRLQLPEAALLEVYQETQ